MSPLDGVDANLTPLAEKVGPALPLLHDREGEAPGGHRALVRGRGARDVCHLAHREARDPLIEFLDAAPEDEEPTTPDEEEGLGEARAQAERGETIPLEELRRELT